MPFTEAPLFQSGPRCISSALGALGWGYQTQSIPNSQSQVVGIYLELPALFPSQLVHHTTPLLQTTFLDLLLKDGAWPHPRGAMLIFQGAMW